jgi:hypothetical protein
MKFNFWQMLGVILLVGGAALLIYREMNKPSGATATQPAAAQTNK